MLTWESSKIVGYDANGDPLERKSGYCVADDTKPTGGSIANGSRLIEIDTGKVYFFNAEDGEWDEFAAGGGGGGGGGAGLFTVTFTITEEFDTGYYYSTMDKTMVEILTAHTAGQMVRGVVHLPDSTIAYIMPLVQIADDGSQALFSSVGVDDAMAPIAVSAMIYVEDDEPSITVTSTTWTADPN